MKVLIVHDYGVPVGGAELMSMALRDGLRRRGHTVRFFASRAKPLPLENVADDTCFGTMSPLRKLIQVANPSAVRSLRRLMEEVRPDVVHVRMFMTQLSPLILPLLTDVPSLLHVVNYDLICPLNTKVLPDGRPCQSQAGVACFRNGCLGPLGTARTIVQRSFWERWKSVFGLVVANSHWVKRRLTEEGVKVDEAVWNGVPVTSQRPPLTGAPVAAYAGRLVPKKGVHILIEAMARVASHVPQARLDIIGDGPERPGLERQAASLGLADHVKFHGHLSRDKMEEHIAGAWVQVAPSIWDEPFGLVAAESMMRGTAAVVSAAGGLAEQVIHGQTGFHVPPGNASALADVLIPLLQSREQAESIGSAARTHALANFTEDRVVERFLELYNRITSRSEA